MRLFSRDASSSRIVMLAIGIVHGLPAYHRDSVVLFNAVECHCFYIVFSYFYIQDKLEMFV